MRLNRVLQLTAGVAMAMAATIFTISCSGEDGSDGRNGANKCTVSGATVYCDGVEVGTLGSGVDGANGGPGGIGDAGANGTACIIGVQVGNSFEIVCGDQLKGTLSGCSTQASAGNANEMEISCGSTVFNICKKTNEAFEIFDTSVKQCQTNGSGTADFTSTDVCGVGDVLFNSQKQYCGFKTEAAFKAGTPAPMDLCGTTAGKNRPNAAIADGEDWVLAAYTTGNPGSWGIASGDAAKWKDEYCSVTVNGFSDAEETKLSETKTTAVPDTVCGTSKVPLKYNDGSWQGQYCGYASATTLKTARTRVSNACGDGGKPDEKAFGDKFCRMKSKTSRYSTLSEADDFCEVASATGAITFSTINEVKNKFTPLSTLDWKNEYCGYTDSLSTDSGKKSVLKGVCDDNEGPNGLGTRVWENQYCQVQFEDSKNGKTKVAGGTEAYCMKDVSTGYRTAGADERLNEKKWNNEYCGYTSKENQEAGEPTRLTGVCGDGNGPNAETWNNGYCQFDKATKKTITVGGISKYCGIDELSPTSDAKGRMNDGTWKDEYCGFASKADFEAEPKVKSVLVGSCDDNNAPNDEGISAWENQYCQVPFANRATGATVAIGTSASSIYDVYCLPDTTGADYDVAPASARLNEKTWKNEYCGFASKADFDASTKVFSKLAGICDDNNAPNQAASTTSWANDYCQADKDGETKNVSGSAGASAVYCLASGSDFATADASARLNENTWKGQYCFADNAIGVCPGGQIPINATESTASPKCAFE